MTPVDSTMKQKLQALDDSAILSLTVKGKRELREPGTSLEPSQLEALVLVDGYSTLAQVVERARSMAPDVLRASLNNLIARGFISIDAEQAADTIDPGFFFTPELAHAALHGGGGQIVAENEADAEFLRRNGYYVNMIRRAEVKVARDDSRKLSVLVIEDDPDICKVLQVCLKLEDFETRTAANREEIVAELRRSPLPDLVLLDVRLTDVNGFDILAKMRKHPALMDLPVIMMTAEASRGAVLRGLQGGADGFITKPFQINSLVRAVKTVLGLKHDTDL